MQLLTQPTEIGTALSGLELIKIQDVQRATAMSRAHIYKLCKAGRFPAPLRIGSRFTRWSSADVAHWLSNPHHWAAAQTSTQQEVGAGK